MTEQDIDNEIAKVINQPSVLRGKADRSTVSDLRNGERGVSISRKLRLLWQLDLLTLKAECHSEQSEESK